MKEAAVAAVVLIFFEAMLGLTQAPTPPRRNGVLLGGATIAASLIQYELLLILSATCVVVLCVHRRGLLLPYLATLVAGIGALVGVTQAALGVPISSKVAYLLGGSLWNPGVASQHMPSLARFLPIPYVPASVVGASYPSLFILAAAGAVAGRAPRPVVTTVAAFTGSFLYFHGIASDLWPRDFVVLTPVVLPFAAVALTEFARWRTRSWALAAALAVLVFGAFAPWSNPAFRQVPWDAEVEVLWGAMTPAIVAGTLALLVGWLLHRRIRLERLGPAIAVALGLALLAQFEFSLPPRTIYRNEIVRNYERLRSERERIGARLGQSIPGATVMAADPWEISLYSGLKSVLIPLDRQSESVRAVQAQYGAQYFLELDPGPPPAFLRAIGAREVDRLEDYRLYRFEGPDVGAPALPSAAFSPSPAPATRRSTNR
jgi:hypothetical protein